MTTRRRWTIWALVGALITSLLAVSATVSASAEGDDAPPKTQVMPSVPVAPVDADTLSIKPSGEPVTADELPRAGVEIETSVADSWTREVEGFSVRSKGAEESAKATLSTETVTLDGEPVAAPAYTIDLTPQPVAAEEAKTDASEEEGAPSASVASPSPEPSAATARQEDLPATVDVKLDYTDFVNAFGADWAGRLRLVTFEDCDESGSGLDCGAMKALKTTADAKNNTLTATVPTQRSSSTSASTMTVAAAPGPSGPQGDYKASSLAPSSSWSAGNQSGDFAWSYPIATPPAINGPTPDLALSYSSGSVDGRTSSTNNQTSWIGEGFSLDPGFVERSYESCDQVGGTPEDVGDMCWRDDNLTISLNGQSSELVQDGSTSQWRMKNDDGTRVELLKQDGINRDDNGEYWRVTTPDGTRYYYGRNQRFDGDDRRTDSVSTVPVYGARAGEPCHGSTFAASACDQAWRWGLDYVVDPNGNTMSYFYDQEKNKYGANKNAIVRSYDRAALLTSIEYGTRQGSDAASAKVVFTSAERCLKTSEVTCESLTKDTASHWPDVPYDRICTSDTSCATRTSPTFFSRKRLAKITTFVKATSNSWSAVNEWNLTHEFPATGDMTNEENAEQAQVRTLWLAQVQQTGKVGTDVSLPPVRFNKELLDNRVYDTNGVDSFARFRVNAIDNGTGGSIAVNYSPRDCTASDKPAAGSLDTNARRCFPVWFRPWWSEDSQLEFFHKYRVDSVVEADNTSGGANVTTSYTYGGGDGWHYTTSNLVEPKYRTWGEWRGYSRVRTEVGAESGKTWSESLYLRGMHGDRAAGGGTKSVTVTDPLGDSADIQDRDERAGFERRTRTQLGASGAVVDITVNTPWTSPATATSNGRSAHIVRLGETETRTRLSSGSYRTVKTTTDYNDRGQPVAVNDLGDTSTAADNRCTTTSFATNATLGMYDYPASQVTTALACGTAPSAPGHIISASRTSYDGQAFGAAPTQGRPTRLETVSGWSNGITYQVDAETQYDVYGRPTSVTDAKGKTTTTAYVPATGGPAEEVRVTNALDHVTVVSPSRSWGTPTSETDAAGAVTNYSYDGLGRVVAVWGPGRDKATQTPSVKFSYKVSATAPNTVTTERLNAAQEYVATVAFYDGLMRERSTQKASPSADGGRVITEKIYDDRGWVSSSRGPYYNSGDVDTTLVSAAENAVPRYANYTYDLAGRVTREALASLGGVKWSTSTAYGGDRVLVTPPTGGTATTTVSDARGQVTSLTQHTASTPTGGGDVTSYTYTPSGQLKKVTDASGTEWSKTYDIRGRLIADDDPDKGESTFTYDELDRPVSATDKRGVTLWTDYDALGRKIALRDDSATGLVRARWTYDTVRKGALASAVRVADGKEYKDEVTAYDSAGRPTSSTLTIPTEEGLLSRSGGYVTGVDYNPDGSVQKITQPLVTGITNENLTYTYDRLGNVKKLTGAVVIVTDNLYSPLGEVLQRTSGSTAGKAVYDTREYDDATRRTTRRAFSLQGSATAPKLDLRYTYDPMGNVKKLNDVAPGDTNQTSATTWRQCFTYDYLRRMTNAWTSSGNSCVAPTASNLGSTAPYSDVYTFAKNGNREKVVSMRAGTSGIVTTTHDPAYPAATSDRPHAALTTTRSGGQTGTTTYAYDEVGNMKKRSTSSTEGKSYEWDREGNVKKVTDLATGKSVEYLYDADGNRLIERDGFDGSTTLLFGSTQLKVKGTTRSAVRTYSLDGEAVATRDSGGLKHTAVDHQGTPLVSVTSTTASVEKRRYSPFGEALTDASATWLSNRGFLNKITDAGPGTVHLEARELDPGAGRFISVDPIADYGDPQQLNGYAYANNSPVTLSDPSGEFVSCECGSNRTAPTKTKNGWHQTAGTVTPGRYVGYSGDPWQLTESRIQAYDTARALGENHAASKRVQASHDALVAEYQKQRTAPAKSFKDMALGLWRVGVFDERSCTQGSKGACAAEIAMAIPILKVAKPLKLIDNVGGAGSKAKKGSGSARSAGDAERAGTTGARSCLRSFAGETAVLMADGSQRPISKIRVGDKVVATDPETGERVIRRVTRLWVHEDEVLDLVLDGEVITTTEDHLFWSVSDQQFERADDLGAGELVLGDGGRHVKVRGFRPGTNRTALAYNLSIAGVHTYHVGGDAILVHNDCSDAAWDIAMKAFDKHGAKMGFKSVEEMGAYVDKVMSSSAGHLREDGSRFWVDYGNSAIVFRGPNAGVPGSVYRPDNFAHAVDEAMDRTVNKS